MTVGAVGSFALVVAFLGALVATGLWARAAATGGGAAAARQATWLFAAGALGAVAAVETALVRLDFSVRFVAENSSRETPLLYRVTSLWSALDGSLLLWVLVLAGYAVVLSRSVPRVGTPVAARLHPWAMTVVSAVAAFFVGLVLMAGTAFQRMSPVPGDGPGPNPLLAEHPAMAVHPPLLYAGYVGLVVPFAYAVAALIVGEAGSGWLHHVRRWSLVAWSFLTAGITLGAWWSYAVLGWGGYWAWDPVENASLLPWLTTSALLHSLLLRRRRQALPAWTVTLASTSFLLVCVGTFLTRSGALQSVHAFTDSPFGPLLLGFVVVVLALVLGLLAVRGSRLGAPVPLGSLLSRETGLLLNNLVLTVLAAAVLLGTLFPLLAEALTGQDAAVGTPYYDRIAAPAALALLLLLVVGPAMRWSQDDPGRVLRRAVLPVAVGCLVVVVGGLATTLPATTVAVLGVAAAVVTTAARGLLGRDVTPRPAHLAHAAFALLVGAVAVSGTATRSVERTIGVGGRATLGSASVQLAGVGTSTDARSSTVYARLELRRGGHSTRTVEPGLRTYPARQMTLAVPAIASGPTGDVYVTVLEVAQDNSSVTLRLATDPAVGWIWAAGGLLALAGVLSALPLRARRLRPAPRPRTPSPDEQLPPAPTLQERV